MNRPEEEFLKSTTAKVIRMIELFDMKQNNKSGYTRRVEEKTVSDMRDFLG